MLQWSGDGSKLNKRKGFSSEVQGPGLARGWSKEYLETEAAFILVLQRIVSGYRMLFSFFCHFYDVRGCPSSQTGAISAPLSGVGPESHPPHCQQQRCFRPVAYVGALQPGRLQSISRQMLGKG